MNCLLCSSPSQKHELSFWKCSKCELIFKDPSLFPKPESEKARYETHNNDGEDPSYLKYLDRLFSLTGFEKGAVLDYGCGPSKGLEALVRHKDLKGVHVESYDPFFFSGADFSRKYDLIFASESLEHFFKPGDELKKMSSLLRSGGVLAISTELHDGKTMGEWWYTRDPTHVVFFGRQTFIETSLDFDFKILSMNSPHVFLQKI